MNGLLPLTELRKDHAKMHPNRVYEAGNGYVVVGKTKQRQSGKHILYPVSISFRSVLFGLGLKRGLTRNEALELGKLLIKTAQDVK